MLVHRAAYLAFVGPLVGGVQVGHTCGASGCFSPDHLLLMPNVRSARRCRRAQSAQVAIGRPPATPSRAAGDALDCGHLAYCRLEDGRCYACLLRELAPEPATVGAGRPVLVDPLDPSGVWGGPPRRFVDRGEALEGRVLAGGGEDDDSA